MLNPRIKNNLYIMYYTGIKILSSIVVLVLIGLRPQLSFATYLNRHAEGWHFYEDRPQQTEQLEPEAPSAAAKPVAPQPLTATQILNNFKAELQQRLHTAIIYPTTANVQAYQQLQKVMLDRSELFGDQWMRVIYHNPRLDYTVGRPVSQVGRHIYNDQQRLKVTRQIKALSQQYGLFFFFRADCPYCHQFAPIIKQFSEKYGWQVMAISLDGSQLPEFPEARADNGAAVRLGVETLPTLLAVDPVSQQVLPLAHSFATQDQIEERVQLLLKGKS